MQVFGQTRSKYASDYALITPDTHVESPLVDWENTASVIHISPEMGARFTQYTALMSEGGRSGSPGETVQRFIYVQAGRCKLTIDSNRTGNELATATSVDQHELVPGSYAFIPADMAHIIACETSAKLLVIEKFYEPHPKHGEPSAVVGHSNDVEGLPFMGDEDARLQTLLPIEPEFDMAVNIFTYQPGAT